MLEDIECEDYEADGVHEFGIPENMGCRCSIGKERGGEFQFRGQITKKVNYLGFDLSHK